MSAIHSPMGREFESVRLVTLGTQIRLGITRKSPSGELGAQGRREPRFRIFNTIYIDECSNIFILGGGQMPTGLRIR